jgi:DNA-binding MarR family transcriptional regulator
MNAIELFILGRKLTKLAEQSFPSASLPTSVRSVLAEVAAHPDSSITNITERTGLLQSHVSASVARLREAGAVVTEPDPSDHRRTLVRVTAETEHRAMVRGTVPVDDTLAQTLGSDDPGQVAEVVAALELLARRLTPRALARIRSNQALAQESDGAE